MGREVLFACLPWAAALAAALVALWLIGRAAGGRFAPRRLAALHTDQQGSAQSLSFVLTLPLFVMVILFIVQVSQLMIATVVVHYAAFAAARAAVVWIPARVLPDELENHTAGFFEDPFTPNQVPPTLDGPSEGGLTFIIAPEGYKYERIRAAAVLACVPISPSRDLGLAVPGRLAVTADTLRYAYARLATRRQSAASMRRLENKLAYADLGTDIEVRFFHSNREPPLVQHWLDPDVEEFAFNEIGWQDQITVTVHHDLALLPGPGRLLARRPAASSPGDPAERIGRMGGVYVYRLTASASMGNEGEKSVIPYDYYPY